MGNYAEKFELDEDEKDLAILTSFTKEELEQAHSDFVKKYASGFMNADEFQDFYTKFFREDTDKKFMNHLFRSFDFNNDGRINFKEFVCGVSMATRGTPEEKLRWTFNIYDVNNDGKITRDEMKEIMRAIYAINGVSELEQQRHGQDAFENLDDDGDGSISVAEFIRGVQGDTRLLQMLEKTIMLTKNPL